MKTTKQNNVGRGGRMITRWAIALCAVGTVTAGCAEPMGSAGPKKEEPAEACVAKCDAFEDDEIQVLTGLRLQELDSTSESQSVRFVGEVSEDILMGIPDGHPLDVTIYASDGASNTDYTVPATLEFEADNVGGYISDPIDTSALLPWQRLTVEISGSMEGLSIEEKWYFSSGEPEGTRGELLPDELVTGLYMNNYQFADGVEESFTLRADIADAIYDVPEDGDELSLEIYADDGAGDPHYAVESKLTYHIDGIGGFISEQIDTSLLLPWDRIRVRVFGAIGQAEVDEEFLFYPGDNDGIHDTREIASRTSYIDEVEIVEGENDEGEFETLSLVATVKPDAAPYPIIEYGDIIVLDIRADGMEYSVPATMHFEVEGRGAYVSGLINTTDLLPYELLSVDFRGRVGSHPIWETFKFFPGDTTGTRFRLD